MDTLILGIGNLILRDDGVGIRIARKLKEESPELEVIETSEVGLTLLDLVIGYDYKLSSCCFDAGFVLDIGEYKGDVLKAWTNGKLNNLRRTHNAGDRQQYPLCAACSFA